MEMEVGSSLASGHECKLVTRTGHDRTLTSFIQCFVCTHNTVSAVTRDGCQCRRSQFSAVCGCTPQLWLAITTSHICLVTDAAETAIKNHSTKATKCGVKICHRKCDMPHTLPVKFFIYFVKLLLNVLINFSPGPLHK